MPKSRGGMTSAKYKEQWRVWLMLLEEASLWPTTGRGALRRDEASLRGLVGRALEPELDQPAPERVGVEPQNPGCALRALDYPIGIRQHLQQVTSLHIFQGRGRGGRRRAGEAGRGGRGRQQIRAQLELGARAQDDRALDDVLQLPDIARPMVGHQLLHRVLRDRPDGPA